VLPLADGPRLEPGQSRVEKSRVLVGTGTEPVALGEVRPAGRKPMAASDWVRGLRLVDGELFGSPS